MLLCAVSGLFTSCGKPYPSTPVMLLQDFWNAASEKDYERLTYLCPGASLGDFEKHFEQTRPSPNITIYLPQPHHLKPEVMVYPVMVFFPRYGKKLFEVALTEAEDGRLVIDRDNSTWEPLPYEEVVKEPSESMIPSATEDLPFFEDLWSEP